MSRKPRKTASKPPSRAAGAKARKVASKRPIALAETDTPLRIARALEAIAAQLSANAPAALSGESFARADAFVWHPNGRLAEVARVSRVEISLLKGIDRMR